MYKVYCDDVLIYSDLCTMDTVNAVSPKLDLADNTAGTFEITLPVGNDGYEIAKRLSSEIVVKRFDEEIWAGRIISEKKNFQNSRILTCEGELAYFLDTTQPPHEYVGVTVYEFIESLITNHNNKIRESESDDKKIFKIGSITVDPWEDLNESSDNEDESSTGINVVINDETTLDVINKYLIEQYGGHIQIRRTYEDGVFCKYFDYLEDYPNTNSQEIRFGRNLLDYTSNWDMSEYFTVILPRGAKIEDSSNESIDTYVDVSSVNGGSRYVTNEGAVLEYGWIEKVVDWNDVTDPNELLTKARQYLEDEQFDNMVIEIKAIDLRYIMNDVQPINLLDRIRCISPPHNMYHLFPVTKLSIQLDKPENSTFTLGETFKDNTLTGSARETNNYILEKIEEIPNEKSILNKAKKNATSIINMATTGFVTTIINQNGSQYLAISSESATTAYDPSKDEWDIGVKLWKWGINGLGYSNNGGRSFGTAITIDGSIVADYITTGTMSADRIRTGILESNEEFEVYQEYKNYYKNDTVRYNEKYYIAVGDILAETSSSLQAHVYPGSPVCWLEYTAPDFSEFSTYDVGDRVFYNKTLYRCINAVVTPGEWDSSKWEEEEEYKANTMYYEGDIIIYMNKELKTPTYWIANANVPMNISPIMRWVEITEHQRNFSLNLNTGKMKINNGSISLGFDYDSKLYAFQLSNEGYLTCNYGRIGGFTINSDSISNSSMSLDSYGIHYYNYENDVIKKIGSFEKQYWIKNKTKYGIVMSLESDKYSSYIGWFKKKDGVQNSYIFKLMYTSEDLSNDDGTYTFSKETIHANCPMHIIPGDKSPYHININDDGFSIFRAYDLNNVPKFQKTETYKVGDVAIHNFKIYKCIREVVNPGVWDSYNWSVMYNGEYPIPIQIRHDMVLSKDSLIFYKTYNNGETEKYGWSIEDGVLNYYSGGTIMARYDEPIIAKFG